MNGTMIQYFHWYTEGDGKLWEEVKHNAKYLAELGITMVWLPPAYKANAGGNSVGYDPYDLFDLGEFDQKGSIPTKYGTKDQYVAAISELKSHGVGAIVDIVLNHKAGGDEKERFNVYKVDPNNRERFLSEPYEIESYTKFTFPGRGKKYSDFEWNFSCFTGVDYAEGEDGHFIYQIITDHGDGWEEVTTNELGNYDFLMYNDIEHRNPFVRQELNHWGKWYHDTTQFEGVRLDAVKHQSPKFYQEWLYSLRANTKKDIFAVGEFWAPGDVNLLEQYIHDTAGSMSLFDAALHHQFHLASKSGNHYDLRKIFDQTLVQSNPKLAVTLTDNHDTQPLQSLEAPVEAWFKPIAYALILLREDGFPCIFYPDLFEAHYKDIGNDGQEHEIFLHKVPGIEEMLKTRKHLAYGVQRDYFSGANCLGWTREGIDGNGGCAVILSNKDAYEKPMEMGIANAGKIYKDILGNCQHPVQTDENGWGLFACPPGSVSVWIQQ